MTHTNQEYDDSLTIAHPRDLWMSVLIQACKDLMIDRRTRTGELKLARTTAIQWFTEADGDFDAVCEYAGLDPVVVKAAYDAGTIHALMAR